VTVRCKLRPEKTDDLNFTPVTRKVYGIRYLTIYGIMTGNSVCPFTRYRQETRYLAIYAVNRN
jgi:hypothetical protein